jgi:hypothetical protein
MKAEAIKLYTDLRDARAQLEKKVAEIKEAENKIKADIIAELDALGIDSFKEGGYTLSRKHNVRAEVTDHAALQEVMFNLMCKAKQEGRPLQDGLLLQRTVSKSSVIDLIRHNLNVREDDELNVTAPEVVEEAKRLGLRLVDDIGLNIRKSK